MCAEFNEEKIVRSINPATLEVNADLPATRVEELKGIVDKAREAQAGWSGLGMKKRLDYLSKVNRYIIDNVDEITRVITIDNGKTLLEALNTELYPVMDALNFVASDAGTLFRPEKLSNPIFPIARIESENIVQPLGVVGMISPWNFPFAIPVTGIIFAVAMGNTVVLKPSEFTPLVGDLIKRIFSEAGFPQSVVSVVQGAGTILGDPLLETGLDKVVFTGSVPVGRHLMRKAAENLTPITLELGGKDPFIVLEDADIERASSAAVWGSFVNAGQVCASVERVYVHENIYEKFIDSVLKKTGGIKVGNGLDSKTDMGPMINERRLAQVEDHVQDAVDNGARVIAGGRRVKGLPGWFFEPTVIVDVDGGMKCVREETFGPTMPVMTFSDEDEVIAMANDSDYGLLSSVWTSDIDRARKLSERIEAGTVVINNCLLTYGFAQVPWGGVKNSGIGVTHSMHGLMEFVRVKNITTQKRMLKEDLWWYPYSQNKYDAMKAGLKSLYCDGLICRAGDFVDAVKAFRVYPKTRSVAPRPSGPRPSE
ncbi:MAG TPA: aldehyde dehydrogenase family protein [bacterium]|nr:aldehyde dehydrogenase family protein [bacterium]